MFTTIDLILVTMFSLTNYYQKYFINYNLHSSDFWGWQYGAKPVMSYFLQHSQSYDQLILMGNFNSPEIFPKFYDPENSCQSKCIIGNLSFYDPTKKQLFAIGSDLIAKTPPNFLLQKLETIYYPNHEPAFFIVEASTPN
jgi:hypothetical protein